MSREQYSIASLAPKIPFYQDNLETIEQISHQLNKDFPGSGAEVMLDVDATGAPTKQAMKWMWPRLMSGQHGSYEGWGNKLPITADREAPYAPLVNQLHYGRFGFMTESPLDTSVQTDMMFGMGGTPSESVKRMLAGVGGDPRNESVKQFVYMGGQRFVGSWGKVTSEQSVDGIFSAIAASGVAEGLSIAVDRSPFIRQQENVENPYASETEIGRLALEATFATVIDWRQGVDITSDPDAHEWTTIVDGTEMVIPARKEAVYTYHTTDGRLLHVLNGAAVQRAQGAARPNSNSQTGEIAHFIDIPDGGNIGIATSLPHIRAGLDVIIRMLVEAPQKIGSAAIVSPLWSPDKELITALGELPATHKADMRLRAVLAGGDPDALELTSL